MRYGNNRGSTFAIKSADVGIGNVETARTIKGRNPFFTGEILIGFDWEDKHSIWGEWIENKRQASGVRKNPNYSLSASKISLQEAMKIMKSLRYLEK